MYIKLSKDMDLTITVNEPIYRGDNLKQKLIYLIPKTVGEIDMRSAYVYLNYVRADGVADVAVLNREDEQYNETYYQYTFPVGCKLTRYPGEVCTWLQIFSGPLSCPVTAKSGECVLQVQDAKNMDGCLCDHQLTALYQIQKSLDEKLAKQDTMVTETLAKKADGLSYNNETRQLQLTSGEDAVGDPVAVPSDDYAIKVADSVEDTWSDMTDTDDGTGLEEWERM